MRVVCVLVVFIVGVTNLPTGSTFPSPGLEKSPPIGFDYDQYKFAEAINNVMGWKSQVTDLDEVFEQGNYDPNSSNTVTYQSISKETIDKICNDFNMNIFIKNEDRLVSCNENRKYTIAKAETGNKADKWNEKIGYPLRDVENEDNEDFESGSRDNRIKREVDAPSNTTKSEETKTQHKGVQAALKNSTVSETPISPPSGAEVKAAGDSKTNSPAKSPAPEAPKDTVKNVSENESENLKSNTTVEETSDSAHVFSVSNTTLEAHLSANVKNETKESENLKSNTTVEETSESVHIFSVSNPTLETHLPANVKNETKENVKNGTIDTSILNSKNGTSDIHENGVLKNMNVTKNASTSDIDEKSIGSTINKENSTMPKNTTENQKTYTSKEGVIHLQTNTSDANTNVTKVDDNMKEAKNNTGKINGSKSVSNVTGSKSVSNVTNINESKNDTDKVNQPSNVTYDSIGHKKGRKMDVVGDVTKVNEKETPMDKKSVAVGNINTKENNLNNTNETANPKTEGSTKKSSVNASSILWFIFGGVILIGGAAMAYKIMKKRETPSQPTNGIKRLRTESGPQSEPQTDMTTESNQIQELKPLMSDAETKTVKDETIEPNSSVNDATNQCKINDMQNENPENRS